MDRKTFSALQTVLLNSLRHLHDRLDCDGCNDLDTESGQDPFLQGLNEEDIQLIKEEYAKRLPEEAEEHDGELVFNIQLIDLLLKIGEDEKKKESVDD